MNIPTKDTIDYCTHYRDRCIQFIKMYRVVNEVCPTIEYHIQMVEMKHKLLMGHPTLDDEQRKKVARIFYKILLDVYHRENEIRNEIKRDISSAGCDTMKWYFITIGYDDKIITPHLINKYCQRVIESKYLTEVRYVNEKHRKDLSGNIYIHHHTHILALSDLAKSRILDRVFATVKSVVANKNYIDVKSYKCKHVGTYQSYLKYINGDKTESKLECVMLDKQWRIKENII